jgi:hypothetical protein
MGTSMKTCRSDVVNGNKGIRIELHVLIFNKKLTNRIYTLSGISGVSSIPRQIFNYIPKGRRLAGRSERRWRDNRTQWETKRK